MSEAMRPMYSILFPGQTEPFEVVDAEARKGVEQLTEDVEELKSGVTQADWNQSDAAAADYIKNKPFGTFDELNVVTEYNSSTYSYSAAMDVLPPYENAGETLTAVFDGVEYALQVKTYGPNLGFGNVGLYDYRSPDDGTPFLWMYNASDNTSTLYTKEGGDHSIRIDGVRTIKKLDEEFLPDNVVMESDLNTFYVWFDEVIDEKSTSTDVFDVTYTKGTLSKSFDEILEAFKANKKIVFVENAMSYSYLNGDMFMTITGVLQTSGTGSGLLIPDNFTAFTFGAVHGPVCNFNGGLPNGVSSYGTMISQGIIYKSTNNEYELNTYRFDLGNPIATE